MAITPTRTIVLACGVTVRESRSKYGAGSTYPCPVHGKQEKIVGVTY